MYPQDRLHSLLNHEMLKDLRVRIVVILWVFVLSRGFWPCVRVSAGLGWCLTEGAHKKRADPELTLSDRHLRTAPPLVQKGGDGQ